MARRFLCYLGFSAIVACAFVSSAQTPATAAGYADPRHVDATQFGERVSLGPNWLFATGDDPGWASPTLDDSGWKTISTQQELFNAGIRDIHSAWYRIHLHVRPDARDLNVATEAVAGSYEIYVNGVRIGAKGRMRGLAFFYQARLLAFPIPLQALNPRGDMVIAILFVVNPSGVRGGGTSTPIGPSSDIWLLSADAAQHDASYTLVHWIWGYLILSGLSFIIGLVALGLFAALRSQREYLAAAAYLLSVSTLFFLDAAMIIFDRTPALEWVDFTFFGAVNVSLIEFIRLVLGVRRTRLLLGLEIAAAICGLWSPLANLGLGTFYFGFFAFFGPNILVNILLIVLLIRAWRAGNLEARILLLAVIFEGFFRNWNFFHFLVYYLHLTHRLVPMPMLHAGSYTLPLGSISDFIFLFTILLFLVLRTVGIARRHAQAASEFEAARTVQQVLIPEDVPSISGFNIQSVYKPAGQVGGDFFQILATENGGVLVVIGDVSGKGMPAAMTVSLLVGTVRTLGHYTQSPGEILAAMNQRMLARSHGGFTTCLVLRCDANGTLTVANAGHIAPYLAGKELPLENGLPLGLAAETTYAESNFQLAPGEQLTLVTDGIVEARDKDGALLGFERSATLSTESAEAIACAAQAFGQDDDITVLTLSYAGAAAVV